MNLKRAVELLEARKRGTCIPAAKEAEAWRMVHRAAYEREAKPAAAMVFQRGAQMPNFTLIPITVVDFYPRKP